MTSNTCNHSSNPTPVSHSQGAKTGRQCSWIALSTTEKAAISREKWGMSADI